MNLASWFTGFRRSREVRSEPKSDSLLDSIIVLSDQIYAQLGFKDQLPLDVAETIKAQIRERFVAILNSENRILECRRNLHECVVEMCRYLVITMPPAPEQDTTSLRGLQGVSGELGAFLVEIVRKDEYLKSAILGEGDDGTDEHIRYLANMLGQRGYWLAASMNICRVAIGDYSPDSGKDWYRPFVHAMCAWAESEYRKKLSLPPAIEGDTDHIIVMAYRVFANIVLQGVTNPFDEWKDRLRDMLEDGSLQLGHHLRERSQ